MFRSKPRRRTQVVGISGWRCTRGGFEFTTEGVRLFFCDLCGDRKILGRDLLGEELCYNCWYFEVVVPALDDREGGFSG